MDIYCYVKQKLLLIQLILFNFKALCQQLFNIHTKTKTKRNNRNKLYFFFILVHL